MNLKLHLRTLSIAEKNSVLTRLSRRVLVFAVLLASCSMGLAQSLTGQSGAAPAAAPAIAPPATGQTAPSASNEISNQPMSMLYPGEDFLLQPGDLISVRVFLQSDYLATVRIGVDGTAQLPFIGSVPLQGLTVRAAQLLVADRLRTGQFYRNPDVIIQVVDTVNGSVLITGELHGTVPVATRRSLKDVLLAAGGLPANASHTVKIVRPGLKDPIVVELGTDLAASETANVQVQPHDIIQITRASVVYVLGAFRSQGAVQLDQASPLTLMQLAALSGGVGFEGKYADLRLIRTVGNDRKVVNVNIKKVLNGKADDPILQANDIVFLPTDAMKSALKGLGISGVFAIVSILIATHAY